MSDIRLRQSKSCDVECMCPRCLMESLDAHLISKGINPARYPIQGVGIPQQTRHMAAGTNVGNGTVRHMSPRQKNYLLFLIKSRDITNLHILPNQTIDPAKIDSMGLPAAKALIDKLINCPELPMTVMEKATPKQKVYIENMMEELNGYGLKISETDINRYNNPSKAIDSLKGLVQVARKHYSEKKTATVETPKPIQEVTEGMYKVGEDIYKVKRSRQSGYLYASKLTELETPEFDKKGNESTHEFEYMGKAPLRFIKAEHKMSLEDAMKFGKQTGTCCQCGRTLTKKVSIDKGIGPICEGKF